MHTHNRFGYALSMALAAALSCGAVATTAFAADKDATADSDQPMSDSWITTKVKAELATTDGVKSMDIEVKTVNGTVMLTGTQATKVAVKKAIAAAKSIKGVKSVDASGLKANG